jgi:hypothetical protein
MFEVAQLVVKINIGDLELPHHIRVVSNVDSPLILGWDFMLVHNISVNPRKNELQVGNKIFPLAYKDPKPPGICRVKTAEEWIIPPHSEVVCPGMLVHDSGNLTLSYDGILEPRNVNYVLVAHILATINDAMISVRIIPLHS